MGDLPWELHAATILEGIIPASVWLHARSTKTEISLPRRLIMVWLLIFFVSDLAFLITLSRGANNLWLRYIFNPTSDVVVLLALSLWQSHPLRRIGIRVAMAVLVGTLSTYRRLYIVPDV